MPTYTLKAEERKIIGKKVKTLRTAGKLPAVIYGSKIKPKSLQIKTTEFKKIYSAAGKNNLVDLIIGKTKRKILIQDVERDPVNDEIIHTDLYAIKMDEKIKTEIPLTFVGKSKAVKDKEGNLIIHKDKIEVEVLPRDLTTPLKTFEDIIKVSDLNIPPNMEVLSDKEDIVANVTPPRSEEELEALEEEVEENVEDVEVTEEKKEEEGEETETEETPKEEISEEKEETKEKK